jgi:phytol kinase
VLGAALLAASATIVLAVVEVLDRNTALAPETLRKVAHVGAGIVGAFAPVALASHWPLLVLCASFAVALVASRRVGLLAPLHRRERGGLGDVAFPVGLYAAFLLARGDGLAFAAAALVLAFADTAAAVIGQRYGRREYRVGSVRRTFEGTAGFAAVAIVIVGVALGVAARLDFGAAVLCTLAVAAGAAAAEALSPSALDNVTVPCTAVVVAGAWLN